MANKKEIRKDNTYIISKESTCNPKLGAKILSDGRESLFLDFYFGYKKEFSEKQGKYIIKKSRRREVLGLYIHHNPRTAEERLHNKQTIEVARRIRFEKEQEMLERGKGYRLEKRQEVNFIDYFQSYIDNYTKSDIRILTGALNRFKNFLHESKEYSKCKGFIKVSQLTPDMMTLFAEYLQLKAKSACGAKSYYNRFRKVINYAIEHDVINKNPCKGITIRVDDKQLLKDILSQEEIICLSKTHYDGENIEVKRGFLFSCYCGTRFCDVKDLNYGNIDFSNKLLHFEQNKTKGHSTSSGVTIKLSDDLLSLIGSPQIEGDKKELIFKLPTHNSCLDHLEKWCKAAGINKHITWHCARHSFGTNMLNNGATIRTTQELLGHSSLAYITRYTRVTDSQKLEAINSLPKLNIEELWKQKN